MTKAFLLFFCSMFLQLIIILPAPAHNSNYSMIDLFYADKTLNTNLWQVIEGSGNVGVYYAKKNVYLKDGALNIVAQREDFVDPKTGAQYNYTSGRVQSTLTTSCGCITFIASMPYGPGIQPALWLHTKDPPRQTLPDGFELDLCEFAGKKNFFYSTIHRNEHGLPTTKYSIGVGPNPDARIGSGINNVPWDIDVTKRNIYTCLWRPGQAIFFFNLKPYTEMRAPWIGRLPMLVKMQVKTRGIPKSWQSGSLPDRAIMKIHSMCVYTGNDAMRMPTPVVPKVPIPMPRN